MAKHDENKDLRLVNKIAKIDYSNKTIRVPKTTVIGIRTLGRIDFLTNYCGWHLVYDNNVVIRNNSVENDSEVKRKREVKKATKEKSLNNKKRNNG